MQKLSLFLLTCLLLAACQPAQQGPDTTTICFAFQDLETEFWVASHQAITETLKERGITVIERNANEDANRQLEQVRDCIAQDADGIILIVQDGESALTIIGEANRAGVPVAVYNRPPASDRRPAIVVVANNESIAQETVEYLAAEARKLGRKVKPLVVVGDLGDQNAVNRRQGFYNVVEANPDLFTEAVEVPSNWDANMALSNLEAALQAHPDVDLIFTSSDFLIPQIRAVLDPLGKWKKIGEPGHVILGGLDGDQTACRLMQEGYLDATGVQDLLYEAEVTLEKMLEAIETDQQMPSAWIEDPGFAYTQANQAERKADMWGCKVLAAQQATP
jgi:inositol transport system substrate-binding protein